jgi:hypothetical protein
VLKDLDSSFSGRQVLLSPTLPNPCGGPVTTAGQLRLVRDFGAGQGRHMPNDQSPSAGEESTEAESGGRAGVPLEERLADLNTLSAVLTESASVPATCSTLRPATNHFAFYRRHRNSSTRSSRRTSFKASSPSRRTRQPPARQPGQLCRTTCGAT